jgi:HPt (histidine-containing phosphotransfer) domain-containing protein
MQGDRDRCLAVGMNGYVAKPLRRQALEAEVNRVLGEPDVPVKSPDAPGTDESSPEKIRRRFTDDEELFRQLAEIFMEDCPARLAEIRDALEREDAPAVARGAHTLKGALGVLCENGPLLAALDVEVAARKNNLDDAQTAYARLEQQIELFRHDLAKVETP